MNPYYAKTNMNSRIDQAARIRELRELRRAARAGARQTSHTGIRGTVGSGLIAIGLRLSSQATN